MRGVAMRTRTSGTSWPGRRQQQGPGTRLLRVLGLVLVLLVVLVLQVVLGHHKRMGWLHRRAERAQGRCLGLTPSRSLRPCQQWWQEQGLLLAACQQLRLQLVVLLVLALVLVMLGCRMGALQGPRRPCRQLLLQEALLVLGRARARRALGATTSGGGASSRLSCRPVCVRTCPARVCSCASQGADMAEGALDGLAGFAWWKT